MVFQNSKEKATQQHRSLASFFCAPPWRFLIKLLWDFMPFLYSVSPMSLMGFVNFSHITPNLFPKEPCLAMCSVMLFIITGSVLLPSIQVRFTHLIDFPWEITAPLDQILKLSGTYLGSTSLLGENNVLLFLCLAYLVQYFSVYVKLF